ncbi:hypothetical protein PR048_026133 [Dryococelus australis]|uniref:DDE-1 domain-containing protein n=1 Tax=Dryococelus australis TaxID=614101 RepID=A0ABQ9GKJ8_9NEOP|nr:hypothetical protein PR048_026133 [Dryococelus australis]
MGHYPIIPGGFPGIPDYPKLYFVFQRTNINQQLLKGVPSGSIGTCHPSGWIQTSIFTDRLKNFISITKPSEDSPVLLLPDKSSSHQKEYWRDKHCKENHVAILCLPPHTTHKLQQLDETLMGPCKGYCCEGIRLWMRKKTRPVKSL